MTRHRSVLGPALVAAAFILVAIPRPGSAQTLDVKLGLWKTTTVVQTSGAPPIDTSSLTPEQRARMEAAMKASQKSAGTPHTFQSCLTKEKLGKGLFHDQSDRSCKETVISSSTTAMAVKMSCDMSGGGTSNGEWRFEALTPEHVKGSGQFVIENAGHKMTGSGTMTSEWVSASCGNVK